MGYLSEMADNLEDAQMYLLRMAVTFLSQSEPGSERMELSSDDQPEVAEDVLEYLEDQDLITPSVDGTFEMTEKGRKIWED